MKRSFLVLTVLLLLAMLTITVSAAGMTATTENKSCAQGGTVTVNVSLSGSATVTSGAVEVVYDKTKLQIVEGAWNTSGAILTNFDTSKDKGAFAFASASTVSGKIFSVKFKVLSDAPLGDTEVKCIIQLKDGSGNDISVTNTAGKITVTCNHNFTKKTTDYPASPASCTSPAKYYYSCSICGEKGSNTYTVGEPGTHTYDKQVATVEYLVNSVDCVDTAEYYYSCECGAKGSETFTGDASWTHNFSESWFVGASGHWHSCADCGAKKDYATHSLADGACADCFFVPENNDVHYHAFGNAWISNDDAHWHECSCGLKNDMEIHKWGDGEVTKPATENADGEMLYTCSDCGKTKIETIERLETGKIDDGKKPENGEKTQGGVKIITVVIISAIVAAVSIVCTVLVMKKKTTKTSVNNENDEKNENSENDENSVTNENVNNQNEE